MKTKSGKSHFECMTKTTRKSGEEIKKLTFVAFDPIEHLERIRKPYVSHGIGFEYWSLKNLDE